MLFMEFTRSYSLVKAVTATGEAFERAGQKLKGTPSATPNAAPSAEPTK